MYGVIDGIGAAFGEIQRAEFRVDFLEVGNGGHAAGFERLYGDDIFDAGTHRVTRHTLGVGDHDAIGDISKDTTQRVNLSRSAATARGRVGLV